MSFSTPKGLRQLGQQQAKFKQTQPFQGWGNGSILTQGWLENANPGL